MYVPSTDDVLAVVADRPGTILFDGGDRHDGWSVLVWDPDHAVTEGAAWPDVGRQLTGGVAPTDTPFAGGVAGYVGYEAGARVESVPSGRPTPEPEVFLGRYAGALCLRHADQRWITAGTRAFQADAASILARARPAPAPPTPAPAPGATAPRAAYTQAVERVLAWIGEGDCYQVNLTRAVTGPTTLSALDAWRRLRGSANAPLAAFVRVDGDTAVLSASPELLLRCDGRSVWSDPIKGTRPRRTPTADDDASAEALRASEKDRAELAMIVDLVRNDLGRVALPGTVTVEERRVTAHATVFHASQRVRATLAPDYDAWHALAACFPPGSVVGAPKVRAAERIRQLEPDPRGVYCGAIGWCAANGDARWNVAIRTAVHHRGTLRYHVGGGIVWDSDPDDEWEETVHKGEALARAFGLLTPPR